MANPQVKAIITAEDRASRTIAGVGGSFKQMAGAVAVGQVAAQAMTKALEAMFDAVKQGVRVAADLETARVGFVTLLGSAEKADAVMARIKREAARTPFEIPGLTQAAQMLTAVTKDGDRAVDFILDIGESLAAMGRGQAELDRMSVNLQQIAATGRAFGIDIRQFAFSGIPIYEMLQEEIGLTGEALQKFIEDGGVTFGLLEKMFKRATDSGGRFHGAFANQAGTFNQLVSNMKDNFNIFLADYVKQTGVFEAVKFAMTGTINVLSFLAKATSVYVGYVKSLKPAFDPAIQTINTQLLPSLRQLWTQLSPILTPALKTVGKVILAIVVSAIIALAQAINIAAKAMTFLNGISMRTIGAFKAVGRALSPLVNAFRSAFNTIISLWNNTVGKISFKTPDWLPGIGGKDFSMPKFATGTSFAPGGMAIVGERGAEMVHLPRGSKVTSADRTRKMSGGNQTINITVKAEAFVGNQQEARKFAKMIMDAMNDVAYMKGQKASQMLGG